MGTTGMTMYKVTLTGMTDLILNRVNIPWADYMKEWVKNPENKKVSVAGDDRTPAWRWMGCLTHDYKRVVIEADYLMSVLRGGGQKTPTGVKNGSFKVISQAGIMVNQANWPLLVEGKEISMADIDSLKDVPLFADHEELVSTLGFSLFTCRVPLVKGSRVIRVRPRFHNWSASGTVTITDERITEQMLQRIFDAAGNFCGLGDWRPGAPSSPGVYGKFSTTLEKIS